MKLVGSKCELVLIPNTIKYLWLRYSVSCKLSNIYQFNLSKYIPAGNYMFKVNYRNTRTRC